MTTIIIDAEQVICSEPDDVNVIVVKPDWNGTDDAGVIYDELTESIRTLVSVDPSGNESFDNQVADIITRLVEERRTYTPKEG